MSLFQESIIRKHLGYLDQELVDQAYLRFNEIYSAKKISNIKIAKEEQYQEGFIKDIFGAVLGYSVFPEQPFNIQTEKKNESDSKKADGAIFKGENVVGVIELKDNKTRNLDAVKDQAFGYKNNHKDCSYVISSNFHKLRFYLDDATDYEEFDLYNLDKETFKRFYLYLQKEGLLDKNIPKLLRQETKFHEENITKSLYKDYSSFKNSFFQNVVKNNPQYDKLLLFKKSQKFLDKVLFVLFAEDKGLVATNSIVQIVEKWNDLKNDAFYTPKPLYELIALFFSNLFIGKKDQKGGVLIPEFGGEIFAPDEVLDALMVDDEVLQDDLLKLSKYDFNTDVDVNILGHIFEHSLSEIEEVEASLKGEVADKTKGKRKKDGVFYTPKYITKYIVENTVGKLCSEKKTELKLDVDIAIFEHQKADGKLNAKGIELYATLNQYKDWLLTLKILDPACGSGAFLNQAVNFLVLEHKFADDIIAELTNSPLRLFDTDIAILENNIYGVDINEESIEIAKLSLWLRTAKQGRKLSNLSNNIKCGNSLIDDPAVAGDKAFNWQNEFPEVFANGGFDVVIGNPPYVRIQNLDYKIIDWLKSNKRTAHKRIDISTLFIEESFKLINEDGIISFITSNQFFKAEYGRLLRGFIKGHLITNIDYSDVIVFEGLSTYVSILTFSRNYFDSLKYIKVIDSKDTLENVNFKEFDFNKLDNETWDFSSNNSLFEKLNKNCRLLGDCADFVYGIITGNDFSFIIKKEDLENYQIEPELLFDFVKPENYSRYKLKYLDKYILYPYNRDNEIISEKTLELNFPNAYKYFLKNKSILENRMDSRMTIKEKGLNWYVIMRKVPPKEIISSKILFYDVGAKPNFYLDETGFAFGGGTSHSLTVKKDININIKFLLSILNSKLLGWVTNEICPVKMGGARKYGLDYIRKLPIKSIDVNSQLPFIERADTMLSLNKELQEQTQKFQRSLERKFALSELPKKLQDWYLLSYAEFIKELEKKKIKLSLSEEAEWETYFSTEAKKALELKAQIEKTDKEIDQMVYALYELTEDEIQIVEES